MSRNCLYVAILGLWIVFFIIALVKSNLWWMIVSTIMLFCVGSLMKNENK